MCFRDIITSIWQNLEWIDRRQKVFVYCCHWCIYIQKYNTQTVYQQYALNVHLSQLCAITVAISNVLNYCCLHHLPGWYLLLWTAICRWLVNVPGEQQRAVEAITGNILTNRVNKTIIYTDFSCLLAWSGWLISAPLDNNNLTTSAWPFVTDIERGVSPFYTRTFLNHAMQFCQ